MRVGLININRRFRDDGRHFTERNGGGGTVIKEDSVEILRRIRGVVRGVDGGEQRNVLDCTSQ